MHGNEGKREYKRFNWELVDAACFIIADRIRADHPDYKEKFAGVVAFPRGGLIPATLLAHMLDLDIVMTTSELDLQVEHDVEGFGRGELFHGKYLLIDDISDSGETFADYIASYSDLIKAGDIEFVTAAICYRPGTAYMPDYTIQDAFDKWVIFPWEQS